MGEEKIIRFVKKTNRQLYLCLFRIFCVFCMVVFFYGMEACNEKSLKQQQEGHEEMPKKSIEAVLKQHTNDLMALSGVVGTGQGLHEGKPCIKVFVAKLTPELEKKIPEQLEGHPIIVEETGAFKSLPKDRN